MRQAKQRFSARAIERARQDRLLKTTINPMFDEIRSSYFPDWDTLHEWHVEFGGITKTRGGATGYCDSRAKTIYLCEREFFQLPTDSGRALLIHEICHDIADGGHSLKWALAMVKVAEQAKTRGEDDIVFYTYSWVRSYSCIEKLRKKDPKLVEFVEHSTDQQEARWSEERLARLELANNSPRPATPSAIDPPVAVIIDDPCTTPGNDAGGKPLDSRGQS